MFEIEKGVPLPEGRQSGSVYPFRFMEIGDSFVVADEDRLKNARAAAYSYSKRSGYKFACRRVDNGWRFWRVS